MEKQKKDDENKVLVKQKLEIVDGTFEVFQDFKEHFVEWIFNIFTENSNLALKRKSNSFLLFKDKMVLLKSNYNYFQLIASFYYRLKNLIADDLPHLKIVPICEDNQEDQMRRNAELISANLNKMLEEDDFGNFDRKEEKITLKSQSKGHLQNCHKFPKELNVEANEFKDLEEWIKKMLLSVVKKHKESRKTRWEDHILYLFRLLAIKY